MAFRRSGRGTLTALAWLASVSVPGAQELTRWQLAGAATQSQPGPLEKRAKPITPENPVPRRAFFVAPQYPPEAASMGVRATVTLRVTIDELGRIGELRSANTPLLGSWLPNPHGDLQAMPAVFAALARSAIDTVRQWQYDPPADGPLAFDVSIAFSPDEDPQVVSHGGMIRAPQAVSGGFSPLQEPLPPGPPPAWVLGTMHVGGSIAPPSKVRHVNPVYPPAAKEARATGVVILEARIEADGRIVNARVLRSIPLLDQAALDAVKQWEFRPTVLNGNPIPVLMTVTIQFSLQ
jgi:TonB family protein